MANKKMGSDPLKWISEEAESSVTEEKKNNDVKKTSNENLPENWTRATFILREDRLKRLKDYAYTDRRTIKDIVNEMIDQYLEGKDIIERKRK